MTVPSPREPGLGLSVTVSRVTQQPAARFLIPSWAFPVTLLSLFDISVSTLAQDSWHAGPEPVSVSLVSTRLCTKIALPLVLWNVIACVRRYVRYCTPYEVHTYIIHRYICTRSLGSRHRVGQPQINPYLPGSQHILSIATARGGRLDGCIST